MNPCTPARTASRALLVAVRLGAALGLAATRLASQDPAEPASPEACAAIESDPQRLACYDRAFGRDRAKEGVPPEPGPGEPDRAGTAPLLDSRWELEPASKLGTFNLRAYQPVYVLPWVGALEANQSPSSPAPGRTVAGSEQLERSEVKFQISFKSKVWQGVFGDTGDLWIAYTQSSRWQLYNAEQSRPFRETNYEPEVLLAFATGYRLAGWDGRLLTVGLNHQSNGRDEPLSRGWTRVIAGLGLEREGWTLTLRPWWRVPESEAADDNPDIEDYLGRADLLLVRHVRHHEVAALVRHSLRGGDRSHGAVQLDWAFPVRGNLRGHVQLFHGYGESLIDYNFRTTRLGLGLALIEWY
ncbi:MAG: phospholipase precursor [Acidobacteria bacterium]|jgi:phospholipase A1|nr:phospholipase precursor [Acidobacteriota bacterium]